MIRPTAIAASLLLLGTAARLQAQAIPTGTQAIHLSAFAGVSGVYTGIDSSRNLSVTAGADLGLRTFFRYEPALEVRAMYPMAKGSVVSEKNILFGVRISRRIGPFRPYGDFLYGRGEMDFAAPGYVTPSGFFLLQTSSSNVLSPGAGVDFYLTPTFSLKADGQFQRNQTPATASNNAYAKVLTFAVVYHIHL